MPVLQEIKTSESHFLKPSKSIKPPTQVSHAQAVLPQPQVNAPTVARLRRLILMPAGLSPEAMRDQIAASSQSRKPVTIVGMNTSAPILAKLAHFFGSSVTDDTQKKVIEAVRQNLGENANSATPRRVEVVGWLPNEGVMTVAVYPES